jgi:hypothetical protein
VLLRGPRLGELAVMDNKSLAEKSVIKMPWCDAGGAKAADKDAPKTENVADEKKAAPPAKPASAPAKKASPKKGTEASDPQEGGQ